MKVLNQYQRSWTFLLMGISAMAAQSAVAGVSCTIDRINTWNTGYQMDVSVTNTGTSAVNGWAVGLQFSEPAQITGSWNATLSSGTLSITATNLNWNAQLAPGQKASFGLQGNHDGSFINPTCSGSGTGSSSVASSVVSSSKASSAVSSSKASSVVSSVVSSSKASSVVSSSKASSSSVASSVVSSSKASSSSMSSSSVSSSKASSSVSSSSSSTSPGSRMSNPFTGAVWYVNPQWRDKALAEAGGSAIANTNTAVWMDRIGAITPNDGTMGLKDHLDATLSQRANTFVFVVYDLPNRDCHALASNGELKQGAEGTRRYRTEYVDAIYNILADAKYKDIRIIAVIEPDSLPNLVTNTSDTDCAAAADTTDGYVPNTQYTLNKLYPLSNVYSYIDIGHSGWLGWDDNLSKSVTLIANTIKGTTNGVKSIAGFISNTAGYTPLVEPFLSTYESSAMPGSNGGTQVRQAKFYEWNTHFGEISYAKAWKAAMVSAGFPSSIGMLIDTSRNGWGGTKRPTALSTSTDLETFVNNSRIDLRSHRGNWCNQKGGMGERPQAQPNADIAAYVWIKPPGESDGAATEALSHDPNDPAKGFDRMCDPTYGRSENSGTVDTGALDNAPVAGRWFSAGFQQLLKDAYPAVK